MEHMELIQCKVLLKYQDQVVQNKGGSWRFQSMDNREREQMRQQEQEFRQFRDHREVSEARAPGRSAGRPSQEFEAAGVRPPRSPIMGRSAEQFGKNQRPPQRYEAPNPDSNVEPAPRRGGGGWYDGDRSSGRGYGGGRSSGGRYGGDRPGGDDRRGPMATGHPPNQNRRRYHSKEKPG